MAKKPKTPVRYEIEGLYPIGHVAMLMKTDPSTWERDWKTWHFCFDKTEAFNTMRAGRYLCHATCPISYTRLRLVQVSSQGRKVLKL